MYPSTARLAKAGLAVWRRIACEAASGSLPTIPAVELVGASDVTNAALIGAGAALFGVIVGGLITAGTTWLFERRRDRADSRQARRLVLEELRSVWNQAGELARGGTYPSALPNSPTFLPDEQWQANRPMLARHLPDEQWDALSSFMDALPATRAIVEAAPRNGPIPNPRRALFADTKDMAADLFRLLSDGQKVNE